LLPEEQLPYFNEFESKDINTCVRDIRNRHLYLYETGKIDISITRISYIAGELEQEGRRNISGLLSPCLCPVENLPPPCGAELIMLPK
jgi:hypothetical protein